MVGIQTTRFDVESLRSRLRSMDDADSSNLVRPRSMCDRRMPTALDC
jgi:hypothetical protein